MAATVVVAGCTRSETASTPLPTDAALSTPSTTTTAPATRPTGLADHTSYAPVTVPPDPILLANELVEVEAALCDADLDAAERRGLARRQQAAYLIVAENTGLLDGVLANAEGPNRAAIERNARSAIAAREITKAQPELPAWEIESPAPADELLAAYREASAASGVRWEYLAAINGIETRMGRLRGTSSAGAQGPMQFLPSTWETYGEGGDINDPRDAILAAGRLLAAHGGAENIDRALYRYNPTEHYVRAVTAHAENMIEDPARYRAYHHWQVYYRHVTGTIVLEAGYGKP